MTDDAAELATRMFGMSRTGDTGSLVAQVDAGAPVDVANQNGDTLVMLAAHHGHAETVRALLERGADPDRANERGRTPLAGAVIRGNPEVVRVLLDGGANPRAGTPSAVDAARGFARTEMLAWFGEHEPGTPRETRRD